jgi:hypothetical protein
MKKVFVVSLILVSIFLIGSSEMALAFDGDDNCQVYTATITVDPPGSLPGPDSWQECIYICYEDGFAEAETCGFYGPDTLELTLEDFGIDAKNLVGFSTEFSEFDKSCHVKLRGGGLRILEADCLLDFGGLVRLHVKGKASNDCICVITD